MGEVHALQGDSKDTDELSGMQSSSLDTIALLQELGPNQSTLPLSLDDRVYRAGGSRTKNLSEFSKVSTIV